MKRTLLVTTALASLFVLSTAQTITATHTSTASAQYTATFTVVEDKSLMPASSTAANLPTTNTWGFDAWVFIEVTIPTFLADAIELEPASSVKLEPEEEYDTVVPVLTFTPNPGWELITEDEADGERSTVWFYTQPVVSDAPFTPLFDEWTLTNFRVRNGQCGDTSYAEIIAAANRAAVHRYSLQANGISGEPETLWSMVK